MNRHSPNRTAREHWKQRYISALINALGAATILHLETDCKTLHALSSEAMGLTSPKKSDTIESGKTPGTIETEGKTMTRFIKKGYKSSKKAHLIYPGAFIEIDGTVYFVCTDTNEERETLQNEIRYNSGYDEIAKKLDISELDEENWRYMDE